MLLSRQFAVLDLCVHLHCWPCQKVTLSLRFTIVCERCLIRWRPLLLVPSKRSRGRASAGCSRRKFTFFTTSFSSSAVSSSDWQFCVCNSPANLIVSCHDAHICQIDERATGARQLQTTRTWITSCDGRGKAAASGTRAQSAVHWALQSATQDIPWNPCS